MRAASLLLSLAVLACGPSYGGEDEDLGDGIGDDPDGPGTDLPGDEPESGPCNQMDILFVIDNSGSMGEEQDNLAANFPDFIDVVNTYQTSAGELLDYRIAVTTTGRDVDYKLAGIQLPPPFPQVPPQEVSEQGDDGAMLQKCGMNKRWLARGDSDVSGTFSCVADVGTSGPSLEMPLYATELALGDRMDDGTNEGFLRDEALLAIVILTDEDDCSRRDNNFTIENDACTSGDPNVAKPSEFVSFLDDVAGARGRWATAVIAGPGPGECTSDFGTAYEASRLRDFVNQTGETAVFSSICDGDLSSALSAALDTFAAACESIPPVL